MATNQLINWLIISPARDRLATAHLSGLKYPGNNIAKGNLRSIFLSRFTSVLLCSRITISLAQWSPKPVFVLLDFTTDFTIFGDLLLVSLNTNYTAIYSLILILFKAKCPDYACLKENFWQLIIFFFMWYEKLITKDPNCAELCCRIYSLFDGSFREIKHYTVPWNLFFNTRSGYVSWHDSEGLGIAVAAGMGSNFTQPSGIKFFPVILTKLSMQSVIRSQKKIYTQQH